MSLESQRYCLNQSIGSLWLLHTTSPIYGILGSRWRKKTKIPGSKFLLASLNSCSLPTVARFEYIVISKVFVAHESQRASFTTRAIRCTGDIPNLEEIPIPHATKGTRINRVPEWGLQQRNQLRLVLLFSRTRSKKCIWKIRRIICVNLFSLEILPFLRKDGLC